MFSLSSGREDWRWCSTDT